jgi:hypothetical protein
MGYPHSDTMNEVNTEHLSDIKGWGVSNCCGAGTYGDNLICEECGEHCGRVQDTP